MSAALETQTGDTLLAVFERHTRDDWAAIDEQVVRPAERCVICGGPHGPECAPCAARWDAKIARTVDR